MKETIALFVIALNIYIGLDKIADAIRKNKK